MTSLTQWTRVWTNSGRQWRTEKPGVLPSMEPQRVGHNLPFEQQHQTQVATHEEVLLCLFLQEATLRQFLDILTHNLKSSNLNFYRNKQKHELLNIFKCYYGPDTEQRALACVLYLNLPLTLICGHYCFFIWQGLKFKETGFPGGLVVKNLPASAGDTGDMGSIPGSGRSPGEGNGNPLQYFLPGKPHEHRSLAGCGLWVAKNWTWLSEWRHTHKG